MKIIKSNHILKNPVEEIKKKISINIFYIIMTKIKLSKIKK